MGLSVGFCSVAHLYEQRSIERSTSPLMAVRSDVGSGL